MGGSGAPPRPPPRGLAAASGEAVLPLTNQELAPT
jgi:hypothetical protein